MRAVEYIGGAAFALAALLATGSKAQDACAGKAQTAVERTICGSPHLVWEDRELNALYRLARKLAPNSEPRLRSEQRRWLADVRDRCATIACLDTAYKSRNESLRGYVNAEADPMPQASTWREEFEPSPGGCRDGYKDYFTTDFVRSPSGKIIGDWEASTFCGNFLNGGLVDVRELGNIYEVRVLGGRGPSHAAGVAVLARKNDRLFVENVFERSSIGAQGDYEFFYKAVLTGGASQLTKAGNDYGETTVEALDEAWRLTADAARDEGTCPANQTIDVCTRKTEP